MTIQVMIKRQVQLGASVCPDVSFFAGELDRLLKPFFKIVQVLLLRLRIEVCSIPEGQTVGRFCKETSLIVDSGGKYETQGEC